MQVKLKDIYNNLGQCNNLGLKKRIEVLAHSHITRLFNDVKTEGINPEQYCAMYLKAAAERVLCLARQDKDKKERHVK